MTIWLSASEDSKGKARLQRDLTGAVTDEWIVVNNDRPYGCLLVGIVIPSAATAKVQFTGQSFETIDTGSPDAIDWAAGDVTETTYTTFPSSTTGIRFVVTSGTIEGVLSI